MTYKTDTNLYKLTFLNPAYNEPKYSEDMNELIENAMSGKYIAIPDKLMKFNAQKNQYEVIGDFSVKK